MKWLKAEEYASVAVLDQQGNDLINPQAGGHRVAGNQQGTVRLVVIKQRSCLHMVMRHRQALIADDTFTEQYNI